MEEKNELNDIILNKGGASTGSKKLLLAIATMTLILIIVLVVMNSLKNNEVQKAPQAILPPTPTAPTEIINDPLFEPVEVIQEGQEVNNSVSPEQDLGQVAQKIKEESLKNAPTSQNVVSTVVAPVAAKPVVQTAPVVQAPAPKPPVVAQKIAEPTVVKTSKPVQKTVQAPPVKQEIKRVVQPTIAVKEKPIAATTKTAEPKVEVKTAPVASNGGTYYIQVGSFTKEPDKALFDRLNASGMKYTTQKSGETSKVIVGPFQGEKAVQDAMGNIRQNIEAKAFKIKG